MIRLPPTSILLGRSDLLEFEERRQNQQNLVTNVEDRLARFAITSSGDAKLHIRSPSHGHLLDKIALGYDYKKHRTSILQQAANSLLSGPHDEPQSGYFKSQPYEGAVDDSTNRPNSYVEIENSYENITQSFFPSSPPTKDVFHFGEFVERPTAVLSASQSSPVTPQDVSTPYGVFLAGTTIVRTGLTLPRSSLFFSHDVSSSPERAPTTGLTPRVVSRVAIHNTPRIMFALPARRPPRQTPRKMRHQTNSFSFDSSERASAAYEQDRISSESTNESGCHPCEIISLHEELRGSSLQSSRATSAATLFAESSCTVDQNDGHLQDDDHLLTDLITTQYTSSPSLSMPHPLSAVCQSDPQIGSLSFSMADELMPYHLRTSLFQNTSLAELEVRKYLDVQAEQVFDNDKCQINRDPLERSSAKLAGLSTKVDTKRSPSSKYREPQTPFRHYQVYDDSKPFSSQPQTPAQLPESRHRSRHHPAETAPVARAAVPRRLWDRRSDGQAGHETPSRNRIPPVTTPMRLGRSASPRGLPYNGFRGLYGGRENGDEERDWAEGVRFSNSEARRWGLRDPGNDGRVLRETPEPEDWRIGR